MTKETLFEAVGELDEAVIAETEQTGAKNKAGWKAAAIGLACAACVGLILIPVMKQRTSDFTGVSPNRPSQLASLPTAANQTNPTEPSVDEQKYCITFLHALGDGSQKTELIENVKFPYRTLIRIRDISGIDEEQFAVVTEEEQEFLDSFFSQYPKEAHNCWGRYRGEDVLITTLSAGSFVLQLEDPDAVESLEISVTDMGYMSLLQRVEDYWCVTLDHHSIYLDGEGLRQALQQSGDGCLTMFWNMSNQAASMIKEDPTLPLSTIQDTVTIRICLKDGREETCSIDMIADDSGNVYAIYRGRTVTA